MAISASMIKDLREATGAGMMDCKKALNETNGDFEAAKDWLREKGIAGAAKKSGRIASEGLVAVATEGNKAAIIELNSETDFVAKNEQFQALVADVAKEALTVDGNLDTLSNKVGSKITDAIATIGENITLRRAAALSVSKGTIQSYIHNQQAEGMGKIGVIVALESDAPAEKLAGIGKQIAMHVAAAKPIALTREEVPSEELDRERKIFSEQARASGKPDSIIEKMVEGRIRKYYEEIVLPEQTFVIDGKSKVSDALAAAEKDAGAPIKITGFIQFTLGEGVEKKEDNFAEEVRAAAGA